MRLLKKAAFCAVMAAGTMALVPAQATAASFFIDFCVVNATECTGDNLTEASLLFESIDGTLDHNDYTLTMTLVGTGTDTIDQVQFTIDGVKTPGGYETRPTVSGPGGGWVVWYDNVSNAGSCAADGGSQGVCANSPGGGPSVNGTNVWTWFVDLNDSLASISEITNVNLRAHFLTSAGGPGGNLSPGGGLLQTTSTPTTTTTTTTTTPSATSTTPSTGTPSGAAPEPTVMTLLGAGLVLAGRRLRRRKA